MKFLDSFQVWWTARPQRERTVLIAGALICGAALLYWSLGAVESLREGAEATRDKEQRTLWRMERRSEELLRLKAQVPTARLNGTQLVSATTNLLERHALPPTILKELPDSSGLQISGQVPFERWMNWLGVAQTELGLVVRQAQVEASETPGMVKLTVELVTRDRAK
jgi:type II secretory pathway component PulM